MKKFVFLCLAYVLNVHSADLNMPFENDDDEEELDLADLDIDEMVEFLNTLKANLENQFQVEIDMKDVIDLAKNMFLSSNEFSEEEKEIACSFYDLLLIKLTTQQYDFWSSPKMFSDEPPELSKQHVRGLSKVVKGTLHYMIPDTENEGVIDMMHGVSIFLSGRT